jgi:hypothetical protein
MREGHPPLGEQRVPNLRMKPRPGNQIQVGGTLGSIDRRLFLKVLSAAAVTTVVEGVRSLAEAQGRGALLPGLIYYVDGQNRLFWNRHDGRADGSFRWAEPTNRQVDTGWDFKHVFAE